MSNILQNSEKCYNISMHSQIKRASMIVAFDGESKCGKTTFAAEVALGAQYQKDLYNGVGLPDHIQETLAAEPAMVMIRNTGFNDISTISAGNIFRAAALYTILEEDRGNKIDNFCLSDAPRIRSMLKEEGMIDFLQDDPDVGRRVSSVAKLAGVQALSGTLFCEAIEQAYFAGDGHNLVIVDARDPVGHMKRNNLLGTGPGKIIPLSVLSTYIDTPTDVAAKRMKGDLALNLQIVAERRHSDATREELPFLAPSITAPIQEWADQVPFWDGSTIQSLEEPLPPLHIMNGEESSLEYVKYIGDILAASAAMATSAIDACMHAKNLQLQFTYARS